MKKISLPLLLITAGALVVSGQSLSRQVIASAGAYFESSIGSLSWTMGEPMTETFSNTSANIVLTQGFQQADKSTVGVKEMFTGDVSISLYPNPTAAMVRLDLTYDKSAKVKIELADLLGRTLFEDELNVTGSHRASYDMDVSKLPGGLYFIRLTDKGKLLGTYRLQKVD